MARTLPRRAVLAALAGAATAGCARPTRLLALAGVGQSLRVHLVGFPSSVAATFATALRRCADAYERAHRGALALTVTSNLIPENAWYDCPPQLLHPPTCPSPLSPYPARPAPEPTAVQLTGAAPLLAQIAKGGLPLWLVKGRTRLDIRFGTDALLPPRIGPHVASGVTDWPDVILAYDLWQYWLAPLGADVGESWKTLTDDRTGLPKHFERFALFYSPTQGAFTAAFALLRNPMVVVTNLAPASRWDWAHFVGGMTASGRKTALDLTGFLQSALFPEATALACAMVVAYGGRLANASANLAPPALSSPGTVAALQEVAKVAALPGARPGGANSEQWVYPEYLWTPLTGVTRSDGVPRTFAPVGALRLWPLPGGPSRRAVPCTYLCATVVGQSRHEQRAQDFASFLMNERSQPALAAAGGGLALRPGQAASTVQRRFPWLGADLVKGLVSSGDDLVAADAFGGPKTTANAAAYDAAADAFARAVAAVQAPGVQPERVAQIVAATVG